MYRRIDCHCSSCVCCSSRPQNHSVTRHSRQHSRLDTVVRRFLPFHPHSHLHPHPHPHPRLTSGPTFGSSSAPAAPACMHVWAITYSSVCNARPASRARTRAQQGTLPIATGSNSVILHPFSHPYPYPHSHPHLQSTSEPAHSVCTRFILLALHASSYFH